MKYRNDLEVWRYRNAGRGAAWASPQAQQGRAVKAAVGEFEPKWEVCTGQQVGPEVRRGKCWRGLDA